MCQCIFNHRGFLESECFECVEEAAHEDHQREEFKEACNATAEFLSDDWLII